MITLGASASLFITSGILVYASNRALVELALDGRAQGDSAVSYFMTSRAVGGIVCAFSLLSLLNIDNAGSDMLLKGR